MLIRQDRVASNPVQERLQHTLASGNHRRVLLRLRLLDRIVAYGLLGRYRGYNERRVQLDEVVAQRLEFRVPMVRFRSLGWPSLSIQTSTIDMNIPLRV